MIIWSTWYFPVELITLLNTEISLPLLTMFFLPLSLSPFYHVVSLYLRIEAVPKGNIMKANPTASVFIYVLLIFILFIYKLKHSFELWKMKWSYNH